MMKIFDNTRSVCPICKNIITADIIERSEGIFIKRTCQKHGDFEAKVAKHAWYYKGLNNFYNTLYGKRPAKKIRPLAYVSDVISPLCNAYNLNHVCFSGCLQGEKDPISLDYFRKNLEKIKNKKFFIQLLSRNPLLKDSTSRDDLPEIIRLISESGNFSDLATDGIRISEDFDYLRRLKDAGLNGVVLWMDALQSREVQIKMRGQDILGAKIKAIGNVKRLKIPFRIAQPVARGINEEEIGKFLDFIRKDELINSFYIRNNNLYGLVPGRKGFMIDELVETAAGQSRGLFTMEDIYYFQKLLYIASVIKGVTQCYLSQVMIVPRGKEKPLRDIFRFEKISKHLDEFEKIWPENRIKALAHLFKCRPVFFRNFPFFYFLINTNFLRLNLSSRLKYYCLVFITGSNNLFECDINKIQRQCKIYSFNLGTENNIPYPYEIFPCHYEIYSDIKKS